MKTLIRNLLSVLRRYRMAAFLNIAGLSVAFAAFIVIFIQIYYERNFDKSYPTSDRIFRVQLAEDRGMFSIMLPRGFVEDVIHSSPHIEAGTLMAYMPPLYMSTLKNGDKTGFREMLIFSHPELTKIFAFDMLEGISDCLQDPEKILIPQSLAHKLFGTDEAVGKSVRVEEGVYIKDNQDYTIGGVYRDFPSNSQMKNVVYTGVDPQYKLDNYGEWSYTCFVLLDDASMKQAVTDNFNGSYDFKHISDDGSVEGIKLTPVTDIYYLNETELGLIFKSGNSETTFILFAIALLIIIVAIINFTNFSTALAPVRIKSINTQKVLGSSDSFLRHTLTMESVVISLLSWAMSLLIVLGLNRLELLSFVDADLSLAVNIPIVLLSGIVALLTGIIAGVYPAWYMVSFPPALVLKGSFGLSASGRKMRTALIGVQFVVSIMLIIGSAFIWLQNDYMKKFSLGFDKDQIAIVELSSDIYEKSKERYIDRLTEFPGIEGVAFAMQKLGGQDMYSTSVLKYKEKEAQFLYIACSYNILDVMGIPITEGRNFTRSDEQSKDATYIFNKTAHLGLDMEVGDPFGTWLPGHIAGFTDDVKITSLRQGEDNVAFVTYDSPPMALKTSYIRMKAGTDVYAAVSHIRKTLKEIDPVFPFEIEFYDTLYNNLYQSEINLRSIITVFSLIAIIISLVGVFGLVVFETQYRRKEIAVRKVHGSTITEILSRLNQHYVYIVCICFVLASPIAYYIIQKWQEGFVYKAPVYWWIYAVAFTVVFLITIATVTFQSWRAASANPIDSLKSE